MPLFKDYAERAAESEAKFEKQQQERLQEMRERDEAAEKARTAILEKAMNAKGLAFNDYDGKMLSDKIAENIKDLVDLQVFRGLSNVEILAEKEPNPLTVNDLLEVVINQNWILIQQNERIARLLENE